MLEQFYQRCADGVRASEDEAKRQVWSRAHLKALRVAALLAVGYNYSSPVVNEEQAQWAISLVEYGNGTFLRRIDSGEVGEGTDGGRERKVLDICGDFLTPGHKMPAWLKDSENMRQNSIVPRKYLQQRTQRLTMFEKHKLGHTAALNMAIKTAITNGNLMEVKGDKLVENFSFHGQAYRVLSLK